jgi:hypothetical protein
MSLYPQKLALTFPTSGGLLVGIVRSRTKATELVRLRELTSGICKDVNNIPIRKKQKVTFIGTERRLKSVLAWQKVTSDGSDYTSLFFLFLFFV